MAGKWVKAGVKLSSLSPNSCVLGGCDRAALVAAVAGRGLCRRRAARCRRAPARRLRERASLRARRRAVAATHHARSDGGGFFRLVRTLSLFDTRWRYIYIIMKKYTYIYILIPRRRTLACRKRETESELQRPALNFGVEWSWKEHSFEALRA